MNPFYTPQPGIMDRVRQLQQTFKGDPRAEVQKMLNSGKITQAQYNAAVQRANEIFRAMK
jgi:hypothetical protein